MYSGTVDELAELVEDVAVHEAPEAMVSGGQSVRVPVGDPCVELEVDVELQVVDNQSWKVQESKQTNVKVEPTMVEG